MRSVSDSKIAVVGLGYVGLLAVRFGKQLDVIGYDVNPRQSTNCGRHRPRGVSDRNCVPRPSWVSPSTRTRWWTRTLHRPTPTPIDAANGQACRRCYPASEAWRTLNKGDVVIYESTVYPGATEERCVPVLESVSGMKFNEDFFVGYSPERINPGHKEHRVSTIDKVTSGSTPEVADFVDELYNLVVKVGTHRAPSIKVAEAAKVIRHAARRQHCADQQLAVLFERLIGTGRAEGGGSKWNFLNPAGSNRGHCIGVGRTTTT